MPESEWDGRPCQARLLRELLRPPPGPPPAPARWWESLPLELLDLSQGLSQPLLKVVLIPPEKHKEEIEKMPEWQKHTEAEVKKFLGR